MVEQRFILSNSSLDNGLQIDRFPGQVGGDLIE